jgi:membrane protease YdiL (CAAX protease family)
MTVQLIDHIIVALIVLVLPIIDFFFIRERAAKIRAGQTELRMKLYRTIISEEWIGTIVIVALWFFLGRSAGELGLIPRFGMLPVVGYGTTVLAFVVMYLQARAVFDSTENQAAFRKQIGWLSFLTPHTDAELRRFDVVSVTAGICEEIVFRGFLTAYFMALFGLPFWGAAILSSIGFGLTHMYQGPFGILKTSMVGGVMALLYGSTGSLWAPILVHAAMDLVAGRMSHAAFRDHEPEGDAPELAA